MSLSRRRKILSAALAVGVAGIAAGFAIFDWVSIRMVAAHQRSTTQELASWEREYSQISTARDAEYASGLIEYAQRYYLVGDGYRSDPETEAQLEAQRQRTIDSISSALAEFKRQEVAKAQAPPSGPPD